MTPSHHTERHPGYIPRRDQRLRRHSEFEALRKPAISRAHPLVVLHAVPNSLPYARFGFVVGRRVAKQAVVRNRVRRWLREAVRLAGIRPGWDLLFIARSLAVGAGFREVYEAVSTVANRAKLAENTRSNVDVPKGQA